MTKSERFELRIDEEQLFRIDDWTSQQPDVLTRAAAIRKLVDIGLSAGSSRSVNFSDGEKILFLIMSDIFNALKIDNPSVDPDFLTSVIYEGHYWALKWQMPGIFHDQISNPKEVDYVVDVLQMWQYIEISYEDLDQSQKEEVIEGAGISSKQVKFRGFDGNNESNQLSIADFLVNKMGRFTEFKGRDLNSHYRTSDKYRRMLCIFKQMQENLCYENFGVQELVDLLKLKSRTDS